MNANKLIELFNDFLVTKNPSQLLPLVSNVECFRSDRLGDGNPIFGEAAPSGLRLLINDLVMSKTSYSLELLGRSGGDNYAIYHGNIISAKNKLPGYISIGVKDDKLSYFIDTACET